MIYGDEKIRQMSRSILPSTARKKARREKRQIARSNRRAVNLSTRALMRDPKCWDDGLILSGDGWGKESELAQYAVRERRAADKLSHFEKWAASRTRHLPKGARVDAMRPILPKGLIGWHAITHLSFLDEFVKLEMTNAIDQPEWRRLYARRRTKSYNWSREGLIATLQTVATDPVARAELNQQLNDQHRTAQSASYDLNSVAKITCKSRYLGYHRWVRYWESEGSDGATKQWLTEPAGRMLATVKLTAIGPTSPPQLAADGVSSFVDQLLFADSTKDPARRHPEWLWTVKSFLTSF